MNPNPKQECFMNSRSRAPPIQELNQRITKKIASRALTNLLKFLTKEMKIKTSPLANWNRLVRLVRAELTGVTAHGSNCSCLEVDEGYL